MTDFERQIYADMKSVDRVLLLMIKANELIEFGEIMTDEDVELLKYVRDELRRKTTV